MWIFVENCSLVVLLIGLTNCAKKNNQLYLKSVARDGEIEGRTDEQEQKEKDRPYFIEPSFKVPNMKPYEKEFS